MIKKIFLFLLIFLLGSACSKVPMTGRKQMNMVSNKVLFPYSFSKYRSILSSSKVETSDRSDQIKRIGEKLRSALVAYINKIGKPSLLDAYQWEYQLIVDETANAFCMPGGKIVFFTGILPVCQDEGGIAAVMAHEIAHAFANHSAERISQALLFNLGSTLGRGLQVGDIFNQLYSPVSNLFLLKYSRNNEKEADKIGLYLMAMAGYDPMQAISFWERMAKEDKKEKPKSPEFLSTHPYSENRVKNLKKEMPKALEYYKQSFISNH